MAVLVKTLPRVFVIETNGKKRRFPDPNSSYSIEDALSLIASGNPDIGNPKEVSQKVNKDALDIICSSQSGTLG